MLASKRSAAAMRKHPAARQQGFMENVDGMPNNTPSYELVYAIQSVNFKTVKIGYSTDVNQRLGSLQSGSPDELKIIGCWLGTEADERQIHQQFAHCRMHREWFYPSKELLQLVSEKNQARKTDVPGKLQLAVPKKGDIEIWETCRAARKSRFQVDDAYIAAVEIMTKAQQLSLSLPTSQAEIAEDILRAGEVVFEDMQGRMALQKNTENCSFCGKNQRQVEKLIAGERAYICSECVSVCSEILSDARKQEIKTRRCFMIQSAKDYIYSAESKRHALQLWLQDYWPQDGDQTSVLSVKQLADDATLDLYLDSDKAKKPITKTYKEWAEGSLGFIATMLEKQSFDLPGLAEAKQMAIQLEERVVEQAAEIERLQGVVAWLSASRSITLSERLSGRIDAVQVESVAPQPAPVTA